MSFVYLNNFILGSNTLAW